MKEGWKMVKLTDISENLDYMRVPITKNVREVGKYPYYGASGVVDYVNDYIYDEDLLLISEDGANLLARATPIAFSVSGKVWVNNHAHVLRFKSLTTQKFVEYFIAGFNIKPYVTGMAQPKLNQRALEKIKLPLPPLEEQHRIVSILDAAFEKIDKLKANAEENLKNAKALFQQVLAQELKPKEGWVEKIIGDVCEVINGRAYKQSELLDKGKYKVLRVGNFFTNNNWYYSDLELDENKYCDNGDLLYAWSASFGPKIWKGDKVIYHYHIWKMLCSDYIDKYFMFYYLNSTLFIQKALKDLHGTTMSHITKGIMESTIVAFPSISEQHRIVQTLDTLSEKCRRLETIAQQTIRECDALKQSILRQAFSGEL